MADLTVAERRKRRLDTSFRTEELAGLRLATQARLVALVVVAVWLFFWVPGPRIAAIELCLLGLAALGIGQFYLRRRWPERAWLGYLFVTLDFGLLAFSMFGLELLMGSPWPAQMFLRNGTVVYYFLFVALIALSYSPRLMAWAGMVGALTWSAGVLLLLDLPGTVTTAGHHSLPAREQLSRHLDPHFVDTDAWQQSIVVLLLMAGVLAVAVWRSRRLARRQAAAERERANLARYFSPNMVDQLAEQDEPLGAVRSQPVAVLFADIVGFTQVAEALPPERVIELLREFHGRMSRAVFDHQGTVDKYIGDAIMATFGTPFTGPGDAGNSVACARVMVAAMADWNRTRWAEGHAPIQAGIGLHYGPAVLGDIGSERRLEFAVIGDTVNVASRLEGLTRTLGVDIAISDELAGRVREEGGAGILDGFAKGQPQQLRNREKPLVVWIWRAG